ncbi:MAG: sel1 repeat family protein, partial [Nitratireductor sp.]|nr:sel1 repeat family protein [Nitratireductor sp.]
MRLFSPIPNSASLLCALVILAGTAMQASAQDTSAQDTSGGAAPSVPSALAISEFDPRADAAYGAFQRGYYLTAFELALERAKNGDAAAQTLIAEMYDKGLGIALDPKEATAWYGLAAESGNPDAQFAYAIKLIEGNHVKKDMAKARVYLQKAAEAGIIVANFNLAQMIVEASGGQSGFAEALPYYRKAA